MLKRTLLIAVLFALVFMAGYGLSSGLFASLLERLQVRLDRLLWPTINYHMTSWNRGGSHYFLLPFDAEAAMLSRPLSFYAMGTIALDALCNTIFQPFFLCVFTPESVLNYILFPFFCYGAIRYFRKVPALIIAFVVLGIYAGMHGSIVEALIRHRMTCELIYLLIGLAGLTGLAGSITKRSY